MPYTIPFAELDKNDIPRAGGKGANLGEMVNAGFPIPPGFVLTTAAYDAFVQANELQNQIVEQAANVSFHNPQSSEAASVAIQKLFLAGEMPEEIRAELLAAYAALAGAAEVPVAVRSSATAEDLPGASFAGQQDTFLNIEDEAALLQAVKQCWASLWTARAIAYRLRQRIDPATVSLAVVVQQLIPADAAGVLFTANPLDGEREQIVINAAWGLGEAIVGGEVTPDTVVVDKTNWQLTSRETTTKTVMTVRTELGTAVQPVPAAQQNEAVLDEETAVTLAKLGTNIETHYNQPMDIEWAIVDGEIAILQARPITNLPPAPLKNVRWEPIVPNTIWMRRQIVEHMPEPLSPLFEDLYLRQGLDYALDQLVIAMGKMGSTDFDLRAMMPQGFAGTINGYAYTAGSFNMTASIIVPILKIYANFPKFFKLPAFNWDEVVLPHYQALITRWKAVDLGEASDEELLQGIREMAAEDSHYWFGSAVYLGLSRVMDTVFDVFLKSFLIQYALPQPRPGSSSFLRGFDSKALDAQADMEALADTIRQAVDLRQLVLDTDASDLLDALAAHPVGRPLLDAIQQYMEDYGHQIYNLDFVDPTQNEDPLPMLLSLKALVANAPKQSVRTRQAQMVAEREALVATTMRALNPLSRLLFRRVWKWTKRFAPYREHVMFYMGAAWPTLRQLAHELGQRLTDAGTIASPNDIYYLDSLEIKGAIAARTLGQKIPEFIQLTEERRTLRQARQQLTPPAKVPERSTLKYGPLDLSMFDPTPTDADENVGAVLRGYAVSPGRVTAPASVIRSVADFARMQPGTILVCTTTTPAWTPLFSQAVGLVTDIGGALAHGSIVAREYGIPAVMGTGMATERIKSGMMLAVDGNSGTVTLVDEFDPQAEAQIQAQQAEEQTAVRKRKLLVVLVIGFIVGLIWWKRRRR